MAEKKYKKIPDVLLGKGTFGIVEKVQGESQAVFACKTIWFPADNEFHRKSGIREYEILKRLKHPNIVEYVDCFVGGTKIELIMGFCEGGSLADFIVGKIRNFGKVSEAYIISVYSQLSSAVLYCHTGIQRDQQGSLINPGDWKPVLHRDIKPGNVLLSTNEETEDVIVKLGDFGLSTFVEFEKHASTYAGTRQYMAPELNHYNQVSVSWTKACDIFSLACTVYELCSRKPLFVARMDEDDKYKSIPDCYSSTLDNLLRACTSFRPEQRPDAWWLAQTLQHRVPTINASKAPSNPDGDAPVSPKSVLLDQSSALAGEMGIQNQEMVEPAALSLDGVTANTQEYLADLQKIAGHIHRCRRLAKIRTPIRVAILDTGCKKDLAFFQEPGRSKQIRGWKDFTASGSAVETDLFGHGTFMARLLMDVAPIVDVYLIRVAEKTDDLQKSQHSIAQAIEHAGLDPEWNVDIISMSFAYFDKPGMSHTIIEEAIEKVKKGRKDKILFLASAGNSWSRRRAFPASYKDVIPIYACDSNGFFLESNPAHTGKKLGTYGKDIPSPIVDEVKNYFPEADLSVGTSIATAIAAGIVAMMLSYAAALPSLIKLNGFEEVCAKLLTKKGMEHMLEAMSLTRNGTEHFISPISYWREKKKDMDLVVSICGAIDQINKQSLE